MFRRNERARWIQSLFAVLLAGLALSACSNDLKVSEVEPANGTSTGGEEVVIKGNGFQPGRGGVVVRFGRREATNVVVQSSSEIKVTTPAGEKSTSADVSVVFDDGKAFVLKNAFSFVDTTQQRQMMDKTFNALGKKE